MVTMFGCDRRPAECASRLKRTRTSASCAGSNTSVSSILMATRRSITLSKASYTTPIAPRPIWLRIWYLPMLAGMLKAPLPETSLSLPAAPVVPEPGEEIRERGHRDSQHQRPDRLLVLLGEGEDGEGVQRRDHHPDHREKQPQLLPERLQGPMRRAFSSSSAARFASSCARARAARSAASSSSSEASTCGASRCLASSSE